MTETPPPKTEIESNFEDIENLFQDPEPDQNIERVSNRLLNLIQKNMIIPIKTALTALPLHRKPPERLVPIKLSALFPAAKPVREKQNQDQPDLSTQPNRITPDSVPAAEHTIDLPLEQIASHKKKAHKGVMVTQTAAKQPPHDFEPKTMIENLKTSVTPLQKKKPRKTEPLKKTTQPKEAAKSSEIKTKSDGDLDSRFEARQKKVQKLVSKEKGSVT